MECAGLACHDSLDAYLSNDLERIQKQYEYYIWESLE